MPPHATDCPGAAALHQRSAPPWEVADIFRLSGETYRRTHPKPGQRIVYISAEISDCVGSL